MSSSDRAPAILITGAASGIGAATAHTLSSPDWPLILIDRDAAGLAAVEQALPGPCMTNAMDVSDPDAWTEPAESAEWPQLTGAVLCAGVSRAVPIADMTFEAWQTVMSVNLDGTFLSLKHALSRTVEGGSIAIISSATARKAAPMTAAYGASKAGVEQLVRVAALEAAPRRIRVNALAPGGVKTPMFSDQTFFADLVDQTGSEAAAWSALAAETPLGRFAEPVEVARMAEWLLSDQSNLVTGAVVDMDGGYGIS